MKILKWIMKALVVLITIFILIAIFGKDLGHTYNKLTWTPPMEINGIEIGMTKSDVVFKLGAPISCTDDKDYCYWDNNNYQVSFKNEMVSYQRTYKSLYSIPFKDTQGMKSLLGDEDLFSESKDFNSRRYTYLKWGASFSFVNDSLVSYGIGNVTWRKIGDSVGKYIVKGTVVCPGTECPFDKEGHMKEDFKDRDYTYFIK